MPVAPFIGLVGQPPMQDLLRCAKHLFVAAMVAWVQPGLPPSANQKTEGHRAVSIFLIEEKIYDNLQLHSLAKRTQFS